MRTRTTAAILVGIIAACWLLSRAATGQQPAGAPPRDAGFGDLVANLKASPGCLGVETARTASGKQVIFAWFADKKAAVGWYQSDAHQQLMKRFFPGQPRHTPLRDVADDAGPIMAVASLTPANKPPSKESPLPVSQIAIELYQPVSGGLFIGGRFAPDAVKVPGMRDYTPEEK